MFRFLPALFALAPTVALAADYAPVTTREAFVALVQDHQLALPLFGISLKVEASGQIEGTAQGAAVTGEWDWKDGMFCRTMRWAATEIPADCQPVEVQDNARLRFTAERGKGKSAVFLLR
jgi:hypothetical protein